MLNLVHLKGNIHIFDSEKKHFVPSRGKYLARAIENLPFDVREIMIDKDRKDQLHIFDILYKPKESE